MNTLRQIRAGSKAKRGQTARRGALLSAALWIWVSKGVEVQVA